MLRSLTMFVLAAAVGTPAIAAQEAQQILATAQARQVERWDTVDNYTVVQSIMGMEVVQYFEKFEADGQPAFRLVPAVEYSAGLTSEDGEPLGAEELREIAAEEDSIAAELKKRRGEGGYEAPSGMSMDELLSNHAMMMRAAAMAHEEAEVGEGGRVDATAGARAMTAFGRRAEVVGTEAVNGREAFVLRAEGLSDVDLGEPDAEAQFTMNTMTVWIDTDHYVLVRTKMEGDLEADGEMRPMTVERLAEDYREVGPLYEPFRQTMRITGLMDALSDKDRKKLEEGRKQMAEAEEQMAQMDASTRSMVEGQMEKAPEDAGGALEAEGAFESEVDVVRIEVNQGSAAVEERLSHGRAGSLGGGSRRLPYHCGSARSSRSRCPRTLAHRVDHLARGSRPNGSSAAGLGYLAQTPRTGRRPSDSLYASKRFESALRVCGGELISEQGVEGGHESLGRRSQLRIHAPHVLVREGLEIFSDDIRVEHYPIRVKRPRQRGPWLVRPVQRASSRLFPRRSWPPAVSNPGTRPFCNCRCCVEGLRERVVSHGEQKVPNRGAEDRGGGHG